MTHNTLVLKFGGASVCTPESFHHVAEIIQKRKAQYKNIVIVVSAMGDTTDELIKLAHCVHPNPPRRELDMLISAGERQSIALLCMALDLKNIDAVSYTGSQAGIITSNHHSDAKIVDIRPKRVVQSLAEGKVVIVAGFQGMSLAGDITTLGRGGSDTTAVAMAVALNADKVEFYKDVQGVYNKDPNQHADAQLLSNLSYTHAYTIIQGGAQILHDRCVKLAEKNNLPLHVLSFKTALEDNTPEQGTQIYLESSIQEHIKLPSESGSVSAILFE